MSERIAILTDTNSGLTTEEANQLGVHLLAMPVIVNNETYFENESISQKVFFECLHRGENISTSQPAPGILMDCWDELLLNYDEVLYIPMSSGLSGSFLTASMFAESYDGKIYVVDNHRISVTLRQSVVEANYLMRQGKTAREIADYLETDGLESSIYIAVNTLELLKKSGRVTPAGAAIGTILNIKPVLQIQGGKLDAYRKVRGMRQAMQAMIQGLKQDQANRFLSQNLAIRAAYSGNAELGLVWQDTLQKAFPDISIGLDPLPISICCHTGEDAIGVGMMKNILC